MSAIINYEKEGRVAIFTINRPEAMNALNAEGMQQFRDRMLEFSNDPELWVGIITGAGKKTFCCGADVKELLSYHMKHPGELEAKPTTPMRGLQLWKPLIAAINGIALGGGLEIALACDIRIASETARLGTPEVTLGLISGWGGTQRLPRLIHWCKAAEMLLAGKIIDAHEAYRIGLVNEVVSLPELMPAAMKWAEAISGAAPLAVRAAKEAMIRGTSMTLEEGLELEKTLQLYLMGTEDYEEGIKAFIEKRKPIYKAR